MMKWQMASRTAALSSTTRIQGMGTETTKIDYLRQYEFSVFFLVLCSRSGAPYAFFRQSTPARYLLHRRHAEIAGAGSSEVNGSRSTVRGDSDLQIVLSCPILGSTPG